jgi:hypothetical protein
MRQLAHGCGTRFAASAAWATVTKSHDRHFKELEESVVGVMRLNVVWAGEFPQVHDLVIKGGPQAIPSVDLSAGRSKAYNAGAIRQ